ncbi:PREDICTED: trinucleotide repeat-containing gene 18 protein-like [Miniopterus natalensis]|uniref:trinucleotide repeat-containing gene 18 protein-like n=1 Tax=Miniopterus natalensis TaxID=291302 RepID=UPI0007A72B0C|nr:PREDICTED: trinucleotide repeat-containing gene 18 protein-like [Miniopterus natalensis]
MLDLPPSSSPSEVDPSDSPGGFQSQSPRRLPGLYGREAQKAPGLGEWQASPRAAGVKPQAPCTGGQQPRERGQRGRSLWEARGGLVHFSSLSLPGFSHLPSGLYPSYLHLNHLEPPSSGSPLLSQLGQPSIFDTQKDGFYLPAPGAPGALHSQAPSSRTPGGHSSGASAKGSSREGAAKERAGRGGEPPPLFGKKDARAREEASAMQSLIKYSGSFAREAGTVRPGACGKKSPFGGLGTMKPEPALTGTTASTATTTTTGAPRAQARLPHPGGPAPAGGRQLKRDPERPESAKAFGREGSGAQGEVEVRHPPVGIAVAVARQKDSGGGGRLGTGLADQERSLSLSNVKGHGRADEDCGDERARHREERLLGARLDRDQEKLLRGCLAGFGGAGHGRADEDCGDERARHREERLLGARLDRDQEKLLR